MQQLVCWAAGQQAGELLARDSLPHCEHYLAQLMQSNSSFLLLRFFVSSLVPGSSPLNSRDFVQLVSGLGLIVK